MTKAIEAAARAILALDGKDWDGVANAIRGYKLRQAQAAITAYLAAMKAEGLVMVPVEATDKICEAGLFANDNALLMGADCTDMRNAYRAMIAAATTHDDGGE